MLKLLRKSSLNNFMSGNVGPFEGEIYAESKVVLNTVEGIKEILKGYVEDGDAAQTEEDEPNELTVV